MTQLVGSELTEKIKILQNEIEILLNDSRTKDKALQSQEMRYVEVCAERDAARGDINKANYISLQKDELVEQGMTEINKFNTLIKNIENDLVMLKGRYETLLDQRNDIGVQLVHRNEELTLLYDKTNSLENIIRGGEIELTKREDEIRILQLHVAELQREMTVHKKLEPLIPKLETEKQKLLTMLDEHVKLADKLSHELESPENLKRWRALEGDLPNKADLEKKVTTIELKINKQQEKVLEKDITLQEAINLVEKLERQLENQKDTLANMASSLSEYKLKSGTISKSLMTAVAQISVQQAQCLAYESEKREKEQVLAQGEQRLKNGHAPTLQAEKNWLHTIQVEDNAQRRREGELANSSGALVSTADFRTNMYIPNTGDEFALPKPFHAELAPLKPAILGSTARHLRNSVRKQDPNPTTTTIV